MKFRSLKTRILFWFTITTSLLLILFSILFYYIFQKSVYSGIEAKLYKEAVFFRDSLNTTNFDTIIKNNQFLTSEIAIIENGKISKKSESLDINSVDPYLNTNKSFIIIDNGETLHALYFITKDKDKKYLVSKKNIDNKVEDLVEIMFITEPLLLFFLIILGNKMIDKILIPIENLTIAAKEISVNNFSKTIPLPKYDDELKKLTDSFNDMINRLQKGVDNLDRFNSDVSHELRTPLTVIKGEIDITLRKIREPEYYINTLTTLQYEAKKIEKIVEDLLLLTKFSKENITDTFEKCNLDLIIMDILLMYKKQLHEKNIKLNIYKLEPISMDGNLQLLRAIFSNLIDNAIKYSPKNKSIYISLKKEDNKIHFTIEDEGIGIPKEEISNVTDRFFRIDKSRNKKIKGFGLGLSIVKNNLELHNGNFKIDSELDKGTKVEITI